MDWSIDYLTGGTALKGSFREHWFRRNDLALLVGLDIATGLQSRRLQEATIVVGAEQVTVVTKGRFFLDSLAYAHRYTDFAASLGPAMLGEDVFVHLQTDGVKFILVRRCLLGYSVVLFQWNEVQEESKLAQLRALSIDPAKGRRDGGGGF